MGSAIPSTGATPPSQPSADGASKFPPPGSEGAFDGKNFSGKLGEAQGPAKDKGADSEGKLSDGDIQKIVSMLLEALGKMGGAKKGEGTGGGGDSGGGGAPVGGGGSPMDALGGLLGDPKKLKEMLEKLGLPPELIDKFMKAAKDGEVNADGKVGGDGGQTNAAPAGATEAADIA